MNLKPLSLAFRILCYISLYFYLLFIFILLGHVISCSFMYVCVHVTDFLKTSLMRFLAVITHEKGGFLKPDKLQNHSNEGNGKKKKKERGEGKEEKRKKLVSFYNGYFGNFTFSKIRLDIHVYQFTLLLYLNFAFETPSIVNENCIKIFIFSL